MARARLVLVGGYLGAGKTTLLLRAARELRAAGMKPGLILNDQAAGLVDTGFAEASGWDVEEVDGGCFCCKLTDLLGAAERLLARSPDVILAEPVGSCIDLVATVIQPLQHEFGALFDVRPFTVLVEPARAGEVLSGAAGSEVEYLFRHQCAEADLVCASKSDLFGAPTDWPWGVDYRLSAASGEGVREWLDEVLGGSRTVGLRRLDEVDYERYARAEAALGWLNYSARIVLGRAVNPAMVAGPLMDAIDAALSGAGARIAHLKVLDRAATGFVKASICANGAEPGVDGDLVASAAREHELRLNLRAEAAPELLEQVVRQAIGRLDGERREETLAAFRPAPPTPERGRPKSETDSST